MDEYDVRKFLLNKSNIISVRFFDEEATYQTYEMSHCSMKDSFEYLKKSKGETKIEVSCDGKGIIVDFIIKDNTEKTLFAYLTIIYVQDDKLNLNFNLWESFNKTITREEYFDFVDQLDLEGIAVLGEL